MEFLYNVILVLHFVGLAALLGGFAAQMKSPDKHVTKVMYHGTLLQLITGVLMVVFAETGWVDEVVNHSVVGIKTLILIAILVIAVWSRRKPAPQVKAWAAVGILTFVNICIAVFAGAASS
jgi:cytochrome bd-type quinol oxidase subunit 2